MLTKTSARQFISQEVERFLEIARAKHGYIPSIEIRFDLKGKAMGMYCSRGTEKFLRFNMTALETEEGRDHLLNNTIAHEVAHYVQYYFWADDRTNKAHGHIWQRVMREFGKVPERCHSVALKAGRRTRRFEYACSCMTHELGANRHKKVLAGQKSFYCNHCKTKIRHTGKVRLKS